MIALTGQVATQILGRHYFQDIPLEKAFGQVAEYSQTVMSNSNHTELMSLACKSAIVNQSVSHMIFPDEVAGELKEDARPATSEGRVSDRRIAPPADAYAQALALLKPAKRPVIIVGHGARFEMDSVIKLAEQLNCPCLLYTSPSPRDQRGSRMPSSA